jgi:dienelactone hydrolase
MTPMRTDLWISFGVRALVPTLLVPTLLVPSKPLLATAQQDVVIVRSDRTPVRVKAYRPWQARCRGAVVVSPGAGGSEQGYAYLGQGLSELGWLTVVVGHNERDRQAIRGSWQGGHLSEALARLIADPSAQASRLADLAVVRRWAQQHCGASKSVLIGHSMGAAAAMIEAGARNNLGIRGTTAFSAYVALSPQGSGSIFPVNAWSDLRRPFLVLTGTRDAGLGGASWRTRLEPFGSMPPGCKWLAVIDWASHLHFAGRGNSLRVQRLTLATITGFLESVERGDCRPTRRDPAVRLQVK